MKLAKNILWLTTTFGVISFPVFLNAAATSDDKNDKGAEDGPVIVYESPFEEPTLARDNFQEMDLLRWPDSGFYGSFNKLMNDLTTAHGAAKPAVMMDFAELYLTQMLLLEAGSVLTSIAPQTPSQTLRHTALMQTLSLLRGLEIDTEQPSPLFAEDRPDRAFWLTLAAIAAGDANELAKHIPLGFAAMVHQPRPVLRSVLPVFVEASVAVQQRNLSQVAVQLINDIPEMSEAPVGHFLRGRVEEMLGNEKSALDAYFLAAEGLDKYAARGRLALADMALRDGAEGALLAARDVLTYGAESWRGDNYELQVLSRLAAVFHKLGNTEGELLTKGKIITRFPSAEETRKARDDVETLLDELYDQGVNGTLPLAIWTSMHLRLLPAFKEHPEFPTQVERLADKAFDLGGYFLAITEYRRALLLTHEIARLYGVEPDPKPINRLGYKLALAQFKAGNVDEARVTIRDVDTAGQIALRQKVATLTLSIMEALGESDRVLDTQLSNPSARQLRSIARAQFDIERWADAVDTYSRLWTEYPHIFRFEDAIYLLIAAHRIGDMDTAQTVAQAFPALTSSSVWIELAGDLIEPPAAIQPLNEEGADARLDRLDKTLNELEASGL